MDKDQLEILYNGFDDPSSKPFYHNGHWIIGLIRAKYVKTEQVEKYTLQLGVDIYGVDSDFVLPITINVSIGEVGDEATREILRSGLLDSSSYYWLDFLNCECPTFEEVVATYLVDGTIRFDIKLDEAPARINS